MKLIAVYKEIILFYLLCQIQFSKDHKNLI